MRVALVQPLHAVVHRKAHAHSGGKEQQRVDQHLAQTRTGAGTCAQHAGEHHDADDIINDSSTDDGSTQETLQVAQLLQRSHRDGHAGGSHDGTDEQCPIELRAAHGGESVEHTIQ